MKKQFKTVFHNTACNYDTIIFSGGKIGYQIEMNLNDLNKLFNYKLDDIIV
jgi:Cys-tRNA(Pro)/Cys-tRNA(Cys) deacylase